MERPGGTLVAMALAFLGVSNAHAGSDDGWYLSAGYGAAPRLFLRRELNDAFVEQFPDSPLTLDATSVSKHNTTWSAAAGYWFAPELAFEAGYLHVGGIHYHAAGSILRSGNSEAANLELYAQSRGATLAVVWTAPLWNAWSAELRAGALLGKTDTQFVSTVDEEQSAQSLSTRFTTPLLGAGGSFAASAHLLVKLEYAHLFGIKEEGFEKKFAADVVTLGLAYAF